MSEQSGSGLGLYHAKQTAELFGGSLEIESKEGKGSTIHFILPIGEAPNWFAKEINLSEKSYLVSLDDDISIHQIWSGRLQSLDLKNIEHIKFQSGEVFEKFVHSHQDQIKDILFLIDYELLNQPKTGLDLIEELGIEKHSILVTSRYEEAEIQSRGIKLNLLILPKSLAGFVPLEIKKIRIKYDAILLDDDSLVHMTWEMKAKNRVKSILCLQTKEELFSKLNEIDPDCPFYIDENLSNGIKGELVTKELFSLGFKNLYLATGYPAEQFTHITWIKGVVGKDPLL